MFIFFLYLIIVQDLLLIGVGAIKLMTSGKAARKTKVVYTKRKMPKNSKNHAIIHSKIL